MSTDLPGTGRLINRIAIVACGLLLALFAVLSYSAVRTKSATYDEPMHALGAWIHFHYGDFRINFEDPPLWQYWAALPNGKDAIKVNFDAESWRRMPENVYNEWQFTVDTLYHTPGNDGAAFVNRSRAMMVALATALGAIIAFWAWRLAGPIAAIIATALYALDPNFLGHGALVKNDVPMALMGTAVFLVAWQVGRKLTWLNALSLALLVAAAVNVKFSAVLLAPMLIVLLGIRALLAQPWPVLGRTLTRPAAKLGIAMLLLAFVAIVSIVAIWACYGFRFNPSPDPSVKLNTQLHLREAVLYRFQAQHPPPRPVPFDPALSLEQRLGPFSEQADALGADLATFKTLPARQPLAGQLAADYANLLDQVSRLEFQARLLRNSAQGFVKNTPPPEQRSDSYGQQLADLCQQLHNASGVLRQAEYEMQFFTYRSGVPAGSPDAFSGLVGFMLDNRMLPSPWLHGLLFVHARSMYRGAFLMGQTSPTGWWYYFPLAMLFKTPVATLLALIGALLLGVRAVVGRGLWVLGRKSSQPPTPNPRPPAIAWPLACLLVPFAVYMVSAMMSNLNIGLRHVLPVYPFMYIAAAALIARGMLGKALIGEQNPHPNPPPEYRRRGKASIWRPAARIGVAALGGMLLAETLLAWPDYIAYFNFVVGGERGGIKLLSDSNLDWGQDLPTLAQWQKQHPDTPLALAYFGIVDPAFYGIRAVSLPPGTPDPQITNGHIIALSATNLQGVYGEGYISYQSLHPIDILGGTIYLYDLRANK